MKKARYQKGISLIEVIVYVAIFSMFVTGLAQFSAMLSNTRLHAQGILEVNDQGSEVLRLMTQTVRNGMSVNSPTIGSSGTSLSVTTNTPATSPTVFSLSGGVIYITEGSDPQVALTNNKVVVSNLSFSNLSRTGTPNIIRISFTIASTSVKDPYSVSFSSSAALRK